MRQKDKPMVSVVTPSYNTGSYIEATIKSVLIQEYENFEHIIIDGNSNDETLDILKKYPHLNWVSESDNGQSEALNKGFKKAKGDYIIWLNSDDLLTKGAINRSLQYLQENPNVDMVYTDINIIDEKDNIYGFTSGGDFNIKDLLENNPVKQPSSVFRRSVIDKLLGVDENLHYVMDREFWLRMYINGFTIKYINGITNASFRLCEGTKTFNDTPKFRKEWFEVITKAFNDGRIQGLSRNDQLHALKITKSGYHLALMEKSFREKKRIKGIISLKNAVIINRALLKNLGLYYKILLGILGVNSDRTKKFK